MSTTTHRAAAFLIMAIATLTLSLSLSTAHRSYNVAQATTPSVADIDW